MALIYELDEITIGNDNSKPQNTDPKKVDGLFYNALEIRGISFDSFAYCEVLFRQLMMAKQFKTGIEYAENKDLESFCGNLSPKDRLRKIKNHIALTKKHANRYGFNRLTFDKKEKVQTLQLDLKKALSKVENLKNHAEELTQDDTTFVDLEAQVEWAFKDFIKRKNNELKQGVYRGKGFVYINAKHELVIDVRKFQFLKLYAVIYYALMNSFFSSIGKMRVHGEEPTKHDLKQEKINEDKNGLRGFIARKLNFEFQKRLGFSPTGDDIIKYLLNRKSFYWIEDEIKSMKIMDEDFFESLK